MNLDTFLDHLDRYGPDVNGWPEAVRPAAIALAADSPEAAAALSHARDLADLLAGLPGQPAPPYLAERIAARVGPATDVWQRLIGWLGGALWRPVLAASVPLAFGFVLGLGLQTPAQTDDAELLESVGLLPFSTRFEEVPDEP